MTFVPGFQYFSGRKSRRSLPNQWPSTSTAGSVLMSDRLLDVLGVRDPPCEVDREGHPDADLRAVLRREDADERVLRGQRGERRLLRRLTALGVLGHRVDLVLGGRGEMRGGRPGRAPVGDLPLDRVALGVLDLDLGQLALGRRHLERAAGLHDRRRRPSGPWSRPPARPWCPPGPNPCPRPSPSRTRNPSPLPRRMRSRRASGSPAPAPGPPFHAVSARQPTPPISVARSSSFSPRTA